jgi:hypothetical protein
MANDAQQRAAGDVRNARTRAQTLCGMKKLLDIDELRHKRQLNVAEQNALTRRRLLEAAMWFRANIDKVPAPVLSFLSSQRVDLSEAIDVDFEDMSVLGLSGLYRGLLITPSGSFWRREVELNDARSELASVEEWRDVTSEHPISEHLPDVGKSFGFLCLDVLREINATQQAVQPDRREDAAPG